jgi:hypothetical protein
MQMTIRFISTVALAVVMLITPKCNSNSNSNSNSNTFLDPTWDSGELQTQIGDKNSNKKKLVMRVWYGYLKVSNGYHWEVHYSIWAENHNQLGSGWHKVNELSSFTFHGVLQIPGGPSTMIDETKDLEGENYYEGDINLGTYNTTVQPVFRSKTATGSRSGGLSITWP